MVRMSRVEAFSTRLSKAHMAAQPSVEEDDDEDEEWDDWEPEGRTSMVEIEAEEAVAAAPTTVEVLAKIQKSTEMGEAIDGDDMLPLSQAVCGTFSCHGIEDDKPKANQDCACVAFPLDNDPSTALLCVLDGHGEKGHVVSNELLVQLYDRITDCTWDKGRTDAQITSQLTSSFEGAHRALEGFALNPETQEPAGKESGAAAVAILLREGRLITAHAGDCRAVLGHRENDAFATVELTQDHKLESELEAKRCLATGAYIRPAMEEPYMAPARIYHSKAYPSRGPGLTMARSLGDMDADECGVIPTPEVGMRTLDADDAFVVLASDGVWEFLSSEEVVEFVGGFYDRGEPATAAARFLIAKAALMWRSEEEDYRDDITAIVVYLKELPEALRFRGGA